MEAQAQTCRAKKKVKNIKNLGSCDIVLAETEKKLEVKWMLHYREDDPFIKGSQGIPFWGFSSGKQFIDKKFDYCVLIAAQKKGHIPNMFSSLNVKK